VFLGYLDEWRKSVNERKGFTAAEKETMMLSRETREGLTMTGIIMHVKVYIHNYCS
jgi:hypothetical protein